MNKQTFINYLSAQHRPVVFSVEWSDDDTGKYETYYFTSKCQIQPDGARLFLIWDNPYGIVDDLQAFYVGTMYINEERGFCYTTTHKSPDDNYSMKLHEILREIPDALNQDRNIAIDVVPIDWHEDIDQAERLFFDEYNYQAWV